MIGRLLWALQRRIWGLDSSSVYQPGPEPRSRSGRLLGPWFLAIVAFAAIGCGGVERHARTALDVSAHALVATDVAVADVYEERAAVHLDAAFAAHPGDLAAARADYADRMRPLFRTRDALELARESLLAAQSGIDAHGADGILGAIGCVADAFDGVLDALAEIGVDPPTKLRRSIDAIRAVAGDRCEVRP